MSDEAEQTGTEAKDDTGEVNVDVKDAGSQEATEDDPETIEKEREERLDPDNRPDFAEIDNSDRDFDPATGMFKDNDEYDDAPEQFVDEEQGGDEDGDGDSDGDD